MSFNIRFNQFKPKKTTDPKIFLIFLGLILLILIPFSWFLVSENIRIYTAFQKSSGVVIDSIVPKNCRRKCDPKKIIQHKQQNQIYTFRTKQRYRNIHQIGDSVSILYNPSNPSEAVLNDEYIWIGPAILSFFTLIFLAIFIVNFPKHFKFYS